MCGNFNSKNNDFSFELNTHKCKLSTSYKCYLLQYSSGGYSTGIGQVFHSDIFLNRMIEK